MAHFKEAIKRIAYYRATLKTTTPAIDVLVSRKSSRLFSSGNWRFVAGMGATVSQYPRTVNNFAKDFAKMKV